MSGCEIDEVEGLLIAACAATKVAATACRAWEDGEDCEDVADTAVNALEIAQQAQAALRLEDDTDGVPETRRARLAGAAWLLLLAGTDEHGESMDLTMSSALFLRAAQA